jgi:capsular exopolysaccharide synthesis family protein
MNLTSVKEGGAMLKTVAPAERAEHEKIGPVVPLTSPRPAARPLDASKIRRSVVTLAPAGAELDDRQQVMVEQFRHLRTKIRALSKELQMRTVLVTSSLPGEGKTTIAANLAGSLSRIEGMRVLLLDFDLRKPALHAVFGAEVPSRAVSPLKGEANWQQSVYRVNRRLDVLLTFTALPEPDLLLQSTRLERILAEARTDYDIIILDSAPLLAVADTQVLVPLVDCALFVVNANETPLGAAQEALGMLRDKVIGSIVNRVDRLKSEGYYLKSGYGYAYGSHRSEE